MNDEEDDGNVAKDDCKDGDKGGTPDDDDYGNVVEKDGNYLWLLQLLHSYLQPVSPVGQSLSSAVYITPWKNKHP